MTVRQRFLSFAIVAPLAIVLLSLWKPAVLWWLLLVVPVIALGLHDLWQRQHAVLRLYPVIGHMRYLLESIRPEIQQYFVESDTDGQPISREYRALVYQRAKRARDTRPFGTIFDIDANGYEWINHSISPVAPKSGHPKVRFGEGSCSQPYDASPLNISAMSYGSLSKNAILALNRGAEIGGFAHNTGEGGLSPYHLEPGGDIIWQIGTGYFGCRRADGGFDAELFKKNAGLAQVKMIEIKLSQGAKPGHGGILPAAKVTHEIAAIRHVPMGEDVISPPAHSTFSSPLGLLEFVEQLRELSGGKPVGFKLCIGRPEEFFAICKAMVESGKTPDFITVDGSEGGTGAAPAEFTNSVGTPLRDALIFVDNALRGIGMRDKVRIIASGKMFSAFHVLRAMALGADTVNSARGMMLALGCIQSRSCNTDRCPTGVATQDPVRTRALVVEDKCQRVANYHAQTIHSLVELLSVAGLERLDQLRPEHIQRRVDGTVVRNYAQLYPHLGDNFLLDAATVPDDWREAWQSAEAGQWN
ncbi:FMN-binding glutamate synthase family protein [Gammaproteobacteria bacterium]|nr:FMN-binding glutamate synthase family protein [Gammaproteobacteria bacterium]